MRSRCVRLTCSSFRPVIRLRKALNRMFRMKFLTSLLHCQPKQQSQRRDNLTQFRNWIKNRLDLIQCKRDLLKVLTDHQFQVDHLKVLRDHPLQMDHQWALIDHQCRVGFHKVSIQFHKALQLVSLKAQIILLLEVLQSE